MKYTSSKKDSELESGEIWGEGCSNLQYCLSNICHINIHVHI